LADEMLVFTRCYDLLTWLMPQAESFPRAFRFTVTRRLTDAALDLQERLFDAQSVRGEARRAALRAADAALGKLRLYLRLAHQWHWLNAGQYEHVSRLVAEIGRLLGGWLKQAARDAQGGAPRGPGRDWLDPATREASLFTMRPTACLGIEESVRTGLACAINSACASARQP
jgi:hypothetical protein